MQNSLAPNLKERWLAPKRLTGTAASALLAVLALATVLLHVASSDQYGNCG